MLSPRLIALNRDEFVLDGGPDRPSISTPHRDDCYLEQLVLGEDSVDCA